MANVSVSGIDGTANEIQGVNAILKEASTTTSTVGDRISKLATEFKSYDNQVVAENMPHTVGYKSSNTYDYYEEYETWVTITGGLEARAASLASKAEQINSLVDKISKEVADSKTIAQAIQSYIETAQSILGDNINVSQTATATALLALGRDGVAKANLATSGVDINSRNFLDYDSIKDDEKLNGGLLSFEKQEDGSYLIKKDGESTGYYTTGLAAGLYMKTLTTSVISENKTKINALENKAIDKLEGISENTPNIKSGTYTKSASKATEKKGNTQATNTVSTDFEKIKQGVSNIAEETKNNTQNLKMSISAKDLSGETRTIDEFKPNRNPDSVTKKYGQTTETYLMDNGSKLIFDKSEGNSSTIMSVVDQKKHVIAQRFFDESGKQSSLYLLNYNNNKFYSVENGKLVCQGEINEG